VHRARHPGLWRPTRVFAQEGEPIRQVSTRAWYKALKRAGIEDFRCHDLRHKFASLMISNGEDIVRVSRLMGHANASITLNVYSNLLRASTIRGAIGSHWFFGNKLETDSSR
jgi:integrase